MKTKIKFSLILSLLCLFAVPSYAQEKKTVMDILTSTTWGSGEEMFDPYTKKHSFTFRKFDNKNYYTSFIPDKDTYKATNINPYYLSDTPDKEFDESKVGKAKDGKYLIMKMAENDIVRYELLEVTSEKFTWRALDYTPGVPITVERSPVDPWKDKEK